MKRRPSQNCSARCSANVLYASSDLVRAAVRPFRGTAEAVHATHHDRHVLCSVDVLPAGGFEHGAFCDAAGGAIPCDAFS
jgi:hypothetical protein